MKKVKKLEQYIWPIQYGPLAKEDAETLVEFSFASTVQGAFKDFYGRIFSNKKQTRAEFLGQ